MIFSFLISPHDLHKKPILQAIAMMLIGLAMSGAQAQTSTTVWRGQERPSVPSISPTSTAGLELNSVVDNSSTTTTTNASPNNGKSISSNLNSNANADNVPVQAETGPSTGANSNSNSNTGSTTANTNLNPNNSLNTGANQAAETMGEFANFTQWQGVADFVDQMVQRNGYNRQQLETQLRQAQYVESAIQLMKPAPPGRAKNWYAYRARFVDPIRINAGAAFWDRYADALARAEAQYGVPADIIVGILGVETIYGRNVGNFRVMDAITTLAFAYPNTPNREPRMAYFRKELENTLLYARDAGIDPFSLYGSYAGAIGLPQFMPGSIRQFAVDFDGDGKVDLRNSPIDAIGSIANFLVKHGWKSGEPIVFPARIKTAAATSNRVPGDGPDSVNASLGWQKFIAQGLEAKYTPKELIDGGVVPVTPLPSDMLFGLVDLQNGAMPTEYWLGANNFFAITQYNHSFFYAMSVIDLGRAIRTARSKM